MLSAKYLLLAALSSAWTIEKGGVAVTGHGDVGERDSFESLTGPVELYEGAALDIAFKIADTPLPHQVFIRVGLNAEPGEVVLIDKVVPAKVRGNNAKAVIPFASIPEELHNYDLNVYALLSNLQGETLQQKLFSLVAFGESDSTFGSLPRLTGTGAWLSPRQNIVHKFLPKSRHLNPVISLAFVGLISFLFFQLLGQWRRICNKTKGVQAVDMRKLGGIVFAELFFVLYYFGLSIFALLTALPLFAVIFI